MKFADELETRVTALLEPHRDVYGEESPVVKMGLRILQVAKQLEAEMAEERALTERAAEVTGWSPQTLQKYARMALKGEELPPGWSNLRVEETSRGYVFVLGSIPEKVES